MKQEKHLFICISTLCFTKIANYPLDYNNLPIKFQ